MQGFLNCVWPLKSIFELYFYSKNTGHNSLENVCTGKKFTLVLNTTYKKVFLTYQVNTRSPSLCLASENAIFGGRRRRRIRKKKVSKPMGDPVGGRDASNTFTILICIIH